MILDTKISIIIKRMLKSNQIADHLGRLQNKLFVIGFSICGRPREYVRHACVIIQNMDIFVGLEPQNWAINVEVMKQLYSSKKFNTMNFLLVETLKIMDIDAFKKHLASAILVKR